MKTTIIVLFPVFLAAGGCAIESGGGDPGDGGGPGCTNDCNMGDRGCEGNGYTTCGYFDEDPCRDWSDPVACASDKICEGGDCVMACSDQCVWGERRCLGDEYQECGYHDEDTCLDWGDQVACPEYQVCQEDTSECWYTYPPGPYGTTYGRTMENVCLEKCVCEGGTVSAETFCMQDFLDKKAIMFGIHTGWCPGCRQLAASLENGLYQPYKDQGFEIILVQLETPTRSSDRTALLNFCCEEKQTKTFTVAIDPGGQKLADYFSLGGVPLSMLLDRRMKIRYKIEGDPSGLEATLQDILAEP
jgi:hypothetical protein